MPPPPRNIPHTPTRRPSSSALLGAFRSLTGGRQRSFNALGSSSPSLLTPTLEYPAVSDDTLAIDDSSEGYQLSDAEQDGADMAEKMAESEEYSYDGKYRGKVIGGPPELTKLLRQLKMEKTIAGKIAVVDQINSVLEQFKVRNIRFLLDTATLLLSTENDPKAFSAAYGLLVRCATHVELSPVERRIIFLTLCKQRSLEELALRLDALQALTDDGKNMDACETDLAPLMVKMLEVCFQMVVDGRKRSKTHKLEAAQREANLQSVFAFIVNVLKFNAKGFTHETLTELCGHLVDICRKTNQSVDIRNCISIMDVLITYTEIPDESLRPCIEVLCDVYRQLKLSGIPELTWAVLKNLFRSHLGGASVKALLDILNEVPTTTDANPMVLRGAVFVLQILTLRNGEQGLPVVPLPDLISALDVALADESPKLLSDVLQLVCRILGHEQLAESLLNERDWTAFARMVLESSVKYRIATQVLPRKSATPEEQAADQRLLDGMQVYLKQITTVLNDLISRMDLYQKQTTMELFLQLGKFVDDKSAETLIQYYTQDRLVYPLHEEFIELATTLLNNIFKDRSRPSKLRVLLLQGLTAPFPTVDYLYDRDQINEFILLVLKFVPRETDVEVLTVLTAFGAAVAADAPKDLFDKIFHVFADTLRDRKGNTYVPSESLSTWSSSQFRKSNSAQISSSQCNVLVRAAISVFLRTVNTSSYKTKKVFGLLLEVVASSEYETDARISALKLLFRLRADAANAIYVVSRSESDKIASVLSRTYDSAVQEQVENRQSRHEEQSNSRDSRNGSSPHTSMSRFITRSSSGPLRTGRAAPPYWMYPGPNGLPEEPPAVASPVLFSDLESRDESEDEPEDDDTVTSDGPNDSERQLLDVSAWLELVITMLRQGSDWEIYSYVVVHVGAQIANQALFSRSVHSIGALQSLICEQIRGPSFPEPPIATSLKKGDVAVCLFHTLTMLMGYHSHFRKDTHDEMVKTFTLGIGNWDRTARWCIHALSICCHELPLSTVKCLDTVLQKMATIITQPHIAIHILEFLAALARLPELYKNFREDEFKMVFGISFRYLQYVRDQRERAPSVASDRLGSRHSAVRDTQYSFDSSLAKSKSPGDDLPQYVYSIAFHVITFWFMSLKLQDRPAYMGWIAKNLAYVDHTGREVLEDLALVTIDMMQRVAYTDRDETQLNPDFARPSDGEVSSRTWIVGSSLMTIQTAGRTGLSQIIHRRPSSTRYSIYQPQFSKAPPHQVPLTIGLEADTFYTSSYIGIMPEDVLQDFYSPLSFPTMSGAIPEYPILLPDDDATRRAVSSIDRTPPVDGHKIGVIYIGEGQTTEAEIFANTNGSLDYTKFISGLGTLTKLKGAKFNTQGLDTVADAHGEFTFCWRDRVSEIVFHITSLMPTDLDRDPQCINKKQHTGNDFVNIVFNNSGHPFNFDTFPSAFNYVYIVISPVSRKSAFKASIYSSDNNPSGDFYRVQLMVKPDFPEISPAAESKIMSAKSLPGYVRLLALNASVFCSVWTYRDAPGESASSWRSRLRDIKRLRERHCPVNNSQHPSPTPPSTSYRESITTSGSLWSQSAARDSVVSVGPFRRERASAATFWSEATSRSSVLSNTTEMERQGSDGSKG
jgi:hypothetical protein